MRLQTWLERVMLLSIDHLHIIVTVSRAFYCWMQCKQSACRVPIGRAKKHSLPKIGCIANLRNKNRHILNNQEMEKITNIQHAHLLFYQMVWLHLSPRNRTALTYCAAALVFRTAQLACKVVMPCKPIGHKRCACYMQKSEHIPRKSMIRERLLHTSIRVYGLRFVTATTLRMKVAAGSFWCIIEEHASSVVHR